MPVLPIQFQLVERYTTFTAEYAISDGDIIYHFFPNIEVQKLPNPKQYWIELFPVALDKSAQEYFQAKFPRLKAAYTEEKASWWMRAFGFGMKLDPHKLANDYLDALDAALDGALKGTT